MPATARARPPATTSEGVFRIAAAAAESGALRIDGATPATTPLDRQRERRQPERPRRFMSAFGIRPTPSKRQHAGQEARPAPAACSTSTVRINNHADHPPPCSNASYAPSLAMKPSVSGTPAIDSAAAPPASAVIGMARRSPASAVMSRVPGLVVDRAGDQE